MFKILCGESDKYRPKMGKYTLCLCSFQIDCYSCNMQMVWHLVFVMASHNVVILSTSKHICLHMLI